VIGVAAAFAAALGVAAANVEDVACVDTTPGESALVGLVQANSGKRLAIVLGKGCEAAGRAIGAPARQRLDMSDGVLRLDEADAVDVLALVDLASPPKRVSLMAPKVGMGGARAKAMRSPALLLRTRRSTKGPAVATHTSPWRWSR
jgi:hypothetical protein